MKLYSDALDNQDIELDHKGFFRISIKEIIKFIGYEPMKRDFKKDLQALRHEPIILNYLEKDGDQGIHRMSFIYEFKLTSKTLRIKFQSLIENILMRKNQKLDNKFLLIDWTIFNSFSGKYEAIIYKLCKDYISVGRTPLFSIEKYREYIGLVNEYKQTGDFTKKCLYLPIKNINKNELSDLNIDVHLKTNGRKIIGIYFTIKEKKHLLYYLK